MNLPNSTILMSNMAISFGSNLIEEDADLFSNAAEDK